MNCAMSGQIQEQLSIFSRKKSEDKIDTLWHIVIVVEFNIAAKNICL
jgi:hypothetical protein